MDTFQAARELAEAHVVRTEQRALRRQLAASLTSADRLGVQVRARDRVARVMIAHNAARPQKHVRVDRLARELSLWMDDLVASRNDAGLLREIAGRIMVEVDRRVQSDEPDVFVRIISGEPAACVPRPVKPEPDES